MALGGSTNTVLHVPAIAHAAGVDFPLRRINEISESVPHLCDMRPYGRYGLVDLDLAGGIPAVMKEISRKLRPGAMTVLSRTIGDIWRDADVRDRRVIHPFEKPLHKTGGVTILFGNLAPDGAVVKSAGVADNMMVHEGPARCFNSEEEATKAIASRIFQPGDVIVVRYEGPKGGPGMREMLTPTSMLSGMGVDNTVALVTDGRFSGGSRGAAIGHVSPEAAARGPIAALRDGDIIRIDVARRTLDVKLDEREIKERLASLPPFTPGKRGVSRSQLQQYRITPPARERCSTTRSNSRRHLPDEVAVTRHLLFRPCAGHVRNIELQSAVSPHECAAASHELDWTPPLSTSAPDERRPEGGD
jgi:dihydroxy-acid dehydratase